jgi:hypothetical protein
MLLHVMPSPLPVPVATVASEEGVNQRSETTPATSVPPITTYAHMYWRNKQQHHPPNIDDNGNIEYEFSRILDSRRVGRRNEYLVEWAGCDAQGKPYAPTWEPSDHLRPADINRYNKNKRVNGSCHYASMCPPIPVISVSAVT